MAVQIVAVAASVGSFFKNLLSSKWLYVALAFIAIGGGTYYALNHWKDEAVATATETADQKGTVKSLEADSEVTRRVQDREQPLIILREQTIKDYANARATLDAQPHAERDAPAPRVIIDTLNHLDRMRANRDAHSIPDAEIPKG